MKGFTEIDLLDKKKMKDNLISMSDRINDSMFNIWAPITSFILFGTSDFLLVGNNTICARMIANRDNYAVTELRVDRNWTKGEIHVTVLYSGDNIVNPYDIDIDIAPIGEGSDITAVGTSVNQLVPAPSSANFLSSHLFRQYEVDANDLAYTLKIQRNGTVDTNAGSLYLLGCGIKYYSHRS